MRSRSTSVEQRSPSFVSALHPKLLSSVRNFHHCLFNDALRIFRHKSNLTRTLSMEVPLL